ncbi:hypothetical protein [Chryseobacterium gossypii]|uniref:hypothetical protein n=1 Tax=Chryseobacterium gossypii TaxID=3231602 RepID=UPI003526801C
MKQFYKSKNLLRLSFLFIVLFSVISVVNSCKDDDDDDEFTDHIVQFEAKGTTGTVFKTVVTQVGTSQNTIFDPTGTTWTSGEMFVNSSQSQLNLAANAVLPNADSKLIVNIWIDGEVAKSDTVEGSGTKSAAVAYSFLEL